MELSDYVIHYNYPYGTFEVYGPTTQISSIFRNLVYPIYDLVSFVTGTKNSQLPRELFVLDHYLTTGDLETAVEFIEDQTVNEDDASEPGRSEVSVDSDEYF